ncbi:uncharacterized protein V1518DRAFT_411790 [Limtongia smithiae]|uniref:uncharacterized protein n=1 Tax=Limtongia smithiae TaxID=1125753 RepID=UPI0034CED364
MAPATVLRCLLGQSCAAARLRPIIRRPLLCVSAIPTNSRLRHAAVVAFSTSPVSQSPPVAPPPPPPSSADFGATLCATSSQPHTQVLSSFLDAFLGGEWIISTAEYLLGTWSLLMEKTAWVGDVSFTVFSAVHDLTGLKWGFVIPLTCILLRVTMTLPVALWSRRNSQRYSRLSSLTRAISSVILRARQRGAIKLLPKEFDVPLATLRAQPAAAKEFVTTPEPNELFSRNFRNFLSENGNNTRSLFRVHILKSSGVGLMQAFILFFGSRGVAHYARLRADDTAVLSDGSFFSNQGMLWFSDLDKVDPYMVLPILFAATTFFNIEGFNRESERMIAFRGGKSGLVAAVFGMLSRMSGLFMVSLSFFYPSSYTIYWLTSALYSIAQNAFMRHYFRTVPEKALAPMLAPPTAAVLASRSLDHAALTRLVQSSKAMAAK